MYKAANYWIENFVKCSVCGRQRLWSYLGHYSGICPEGTAGNHDKAVRIIGYPDRDSKTTPPDYKPEILRL